MNRRIPQSAAIMGSLALIVLAVSLAYAPMLRNGFTNWDDPYYVVNNPDIRGLGAANLHRLFTGYYVSNYQPVTMLTYAVDYRLAGLDPRQYDRTNLAFHIANALLVFCLLWLLFGEHAPALAGALAWGLHPLHVESIAWISERKDLVYAFFLLLAIIAYLIYCKRGRRGSYYAALALFICACLSKGMAVILPVLLLVIDHWHGQAFSRRRLFEKIPFAAVSVFFGIVAMIGQRTAFRPGPEYTAMDQVLVAAHGFLFYLVKTIVPLNLSAIYPYPVKIGRMMPLAYALSPYIAVAVLAAAVWFGRKRRAVADGGMFFLACFLPVSQLLPVGTAVSADRYYYLSSLGLMLIIGWGTGALLRSRWRYGAAVGFAAVLLWWGAGARQRVRVWHSNITLLEDVVNQYDNAFQAYTNLASEYVNAGQFRKAIEYSDRALRLDSTLSRPYFNKGLAYFYLGLHDSALVNLNRSVAYEPYYADAYINRGLTLAALGKIAQAKRDYAVALVLSPGNTDALFDRAVLLEQEGDVRGAATDLESILQADSSYGKAYKPLARMAIRGKKYNEAVKQLTRFLNQYPASGEGYWLRGMAYRALGEQAPAVADSLRSLSLGYQPRSGGRR